MKIVKQKDFDEFRCLANNCPSTCCTGWEIDVDEQSLKRFESLDGEIRDKLFKAIDFNRGIIKYTDEGVCAFLRKDGLCSLVCDYGEDILCEICHMYPRHVEEYDGVREWSLALSCPEAARMVINSDRFDIISNDNDDEETYDDFDDFDYLLYTQLEDSREVLFNIIQNTECSILERMSLILNLARKLQKCIDENQIFEMETILSNYDINTALDTLKLEYKNNHISDDCILDNRLLFEYIEQNYEVFDKLEVLKEDWKIVLNKGSEYINKGLDNFVNEYKSHDKYMENILMSLIYTYYLGAVYDDYLYSKVAMCVFITIMMDFFYYSLDEEYTMVVSKMAREVEHSDDNLNALEEYFDNNEI